MFYENNGVLKNFTKQTNKHIIMAGDFNLFFNSKLDAAGGNPTLKRKSLAKLTKLKVTYDLYDIWRIRNAKVKQFTFTQQHSSGFIQRRLDYFYVSNDLQKFASNTDILSPISTDHSPVLFSLSKEKGNIRSKDFWKFNSSLIKDQNYINEIKDLVRNFNTKIDCDFSRQLKWEFLKYEIRQFTIHYTKGLAKERKQKILNLESELKKLEISLDDANNLGKYNSIKNELDAIYDDIAESIGIRSKCDWYEHGKKSTKLF